MLTIKLNNMTHRNSAVQVDSDAKDIVLSFIKALNDERFDDARTFANDHMTFTGVLGSRNGADEYFKDMKQMKLKYRIKKTFSEDDDVCLLYDLAMGDTSIFGCGWYHLEDGKISSLKVVFDPRPLLKQKS